jgi:predicted alpha/beta superfamily hydrolase
MRLSFLLVPVVFAAACSSAGGSSSSGAAADGGGGGPATSDGGSDASVIANDASSPIDGGAPASDAGSDGALSDGGAARTTVRVHYPAGTHQLTLRGSAGPLNWTQGIALTAGANDTWTYSTDLVSTAIDLKPLLDDTTWSRGPNYHVLPGQTVDLYPHFVTVTGSYSRRWPSFTSTVLPSTRGILVYLPPSYAENTTARFPVLYMHDGQNIFDASTAFGGNEWKVDETMNAGAEDGTVREAIVIGVENTGDRMNELTPTYDAGTGAGGKADLYLKMIVTEIKPMVDLALRTMPARESTSMMGSSLGGLVTAYAGVRNADTFALVGAMSPSTWWDNRMILGEVATTPTRSAKPARVYVDSGDSGPSNDDVTNTAALAAQYRTAGYADGTTLKYVVQAGGQHNEIYWSQRLPAALAFLLGPAR